ncbi:TY-Chap domain-containing protein [Nocardia sp. NPDC055321]
MTESWDELAREMTTFHEEQIEANLEGFEMGEDPDPDTEHYIEVLDHETGCYVRFQIVNDSEVWISGTVPQDPERARSIADILRRCEGSSLFCGYHDPTWTLGWSHQFTDHNDRLKITRPLAEVMRDGLGMELQRLRIRLWSNDFGPGYNSYRLVSDRPSERGAPARCTTWADFVDRLDWTLHTLQPHSELYLSTDNSWVFAMLTHAHSHTLAFETGVPKVVAPDAKQFETGMVDLGWRASDKSLRTWRMPSAVDEAEPSLRGVAARVMMTLRDVVAVDSPRDLRFSAFGEHNRLSYLPLELGLDREPLDHEANGRP